MPAKEATIIRGHITIDAMMPITPSMIVAIPIPFLDLTVSAAKIIATIAKIIEKRIVQQNTILKIARMRPIIDNAFLVPSLILFYLLSRFINLKIYFNIF
jgi:hypothetical protein